MLSESMQRVVKHDSASVALFDRTMGQLRLQALTYTVGHEVVAPDITLTLDGSAAGITFQSGIARVFRRDDLDRSSRTVRRCSPRRCSLCAASPW